MNAPRLPAPAEGKLAPALIACDLDDTLLTEALAISDYSAAVISRAAAKGIYVALCSGRAKGAMLPHAERLGIAAADAGRYLVTQNGSSICDLRLAEEIFRRTLPHETLLAALKTADAYGLSCQVYDDAAIYTPEASEWVRADSRLSGLRLCVVKDFAAFLSPGYPKLVISGKPELIAQAEQTLRGTIGGECGIFTSKPYFLEIMPKGCGKGEALEWLARRLGIPLERVMAFGDSMNDESMMRYAGMSVAMINGDERICRQARFVTAYSHNDDGVARFIERFVRLDE